MTGFLPDDLTGTVGTWVAALLTLGVWAYLAGERRFFRYAQHLLAGLLTGYVVVLSVREVLYPRLIEPLSRDPGGQVLLWPAALLAVVLMGARFVPRPLAALPISLLVAGTAAFALAGAVAGTLAPQLAGAMLSTRDGAAGVASGAAALLIIGLVLLSFRHGVRPQGFAWRASNVGRWVLLAGLGGWFGFAILGRLTMVVERAGFLLFEWLKIGR